jgi:hypothetical protein
MMRSHIWLPCLFLMAASCFGGTVSITGSLDAPLDLQWDPFLYVFTLADVSDVTVQSFGYSGGVNAAGATIPAGGFAPILSMFSGDGPSAVFLGLNEGASCTGCSDPLLQFAGLAAGTYTLAITAYANYPWAFADPATASTFGDGFQGLGFLGSGETTAFAVDVTTTISSGAGGAGAVPEPATVLLVGTALGTVLGARGRSFLRPGRAARQEQSKIKS